jgi:hypothetical protein
VVWFFNQLCYDESAKSSGFCEFLCPQVLDILEHNRRRHRSSGNASAESNTESLSIGSFSQQSRDSASLNPQSFSSDSSSEVPQNLSQLGSCAKDFGSEVIISRVDQREKPASSTDLSTKQHTTPSADKNEELQNEILYISKSLTDISHRLESASTHDISCDQSPLVDCEATDKVANENSSQASSGLGWSVFGSFEGISGELVEESISGAELPAKNPAVMPQRLHAARCAVV